METDNYKPRFETQAVITNSYHRAIGTVKQLSTHRPISKRDIVTT